MKNTNSISNPTCDRDTLRECWETLHNMLLLLCTQFRRDDYMTPFYANAATLMLTLRRTGTNKDAEAELS